MKKTYILDTNVLLHDPYAIYKFEDNDIVIPMVVVEELDKIKVGADETARNARQAIRELDKLRAPGTLYRGVTLGSGKGNIKVEINHQAEGLPAYLDKTNDNRILSVAIGVKKEKQYISLQTPVVLVTRDVNLRVKADVFDVASEDFKSGKVILKDMDNSFYSCEGKGKLVITKSKERDGWYLVQEEGKDPVGMPDNSFIVQKGDSLHRLKCGILNDVSINKVVWGIKPDNIYQHCAVSLLLDQAVNLVAITGIAGSGKTLLSVACGLKEIIEGKAYRRLLVTKAIVPIGNDIGFIPGTVEEKLAPWMQSLHDTVDYLVSAGSAPPFAKNKHYTIKRLTENGLLQMEPLIYMRGRSLPGQFIIVDEAQNMTVHQVKTLITRAGEGTKVVLLGDINQIDTPYLDSESNGLSYVISKFRGNRLFGHINLVKGKRSELSEEAVKVL